MTRILCPARGSVVHDAAGHHRTGEYFWCAGPSGMHCDREILGGNESSESVLIQCQPGGELLEVVPEASGTLMLLVGCIALFFLGRRADLEVGR